jgi:hypothetical protein
MGASLMVWITVEAERALYVARGRDTILCDDRHHDNQVTLVVRLSPEAIQKLKTDLERK